ncbi:uncharacterized protein LOC142321028 [Lycorma delicatula]|uniref:uncharacterized protein LOC142321028 n=1 Tax=Lycorma delicatula TaxID=130591 RepID=UPI003F516358
MWEQYLWLLVLVFAYIKNFGEFSRWPKPPDPKEEFLSWNREGDLLLFVRTLPCAPVTMITGIYKNRVNIAVNGKTGSADARNSLLELLSRLLRIPTEKMTIIKGQNSTFKTISIQRNTIRYGRVYTRIIGKHVIPFMLNLTQSTEPPPSTKVYYYYEDDEDFDYDEEYYKELEKEEELARLRGEQLSDDSYYYEQ